MTTEVFIPFDGFYCSWIDDEIDRDIGSYLEEYDKDFDEVEIKTNIEDIAREYVDLYNATLRENLENQDKKHFFVEFKFKELISPREYNFETDRILCTFEDPPIMLHAIYSTLCDAKNLGRDIRERFESRSGFASFYDEFVRTWPTKMIRDWDYNELSVLLPYFEFDDFDDSDLTTFREAISNNVEIKEINNA